MKKTLLVCMLLIAIVLSFAACGGNNNETPVHTHNFGEWETTVKPTCAEDGTKVRYCDCGEKQSETIRMLDHSYSERVLTPHTIDNKGEMIYECANCNYSYTKPIGHRYNLTEMVNPTCYEDGYSIYSCDCGSFYKANYTETSGHVMGYKEYYIINPNANVCEWTNPWFSKCTACGFVEYGADGATGHDFVDGRCTHCDKVDPQGDDVH